MSKHAGRLSLGALPKTETVKVTITLPVDLKARLDRYAVLHSQAHGETVDAAALIPHMLGAFITRDREFLKRSRTSDALSVPTPSTST
ncbi:MAG: DUF2274 domain-containing protein [Pseudoxanthomonas sp.]|nr:DUF2274 domain-containing protein [Pseudoxanthomonas sp.]